MTLTLPNNAEELKRCIEEAFADAVYPGDGSVVPQIERDSGEYQDTGDFFRGRHWRELSGADQKLQTGWGGLSFLSPAAWRFYLPAYLLVSLGGGEYAEDVSWSALHALSPGTGDLALCFQERASGFCPAQQRCLAAYTAAWSELEPGYETYRAAAAYWKDKVANQTTF